MRHLYITLILLALMACSKNIVPEQQASVVTYELSAGVEMEIKSAQTQDISANIVWYGVFHKNNDGTYTYMSDMSSFVKIEDPNSIIVPITLITGQQYRIAFVAQYKDLEQEKYTYLINGDGEMYLNSPNSLTLDGSKLDVYTYCDEITTVSQVPKKKFSLTRPVAQINIGTSAQPNSEYTIGFSNVPVKYNLFNGTFSSDVHTLTLTGAPYGGEMEVNGVTYNHLSKFYVFGGNTHICSINRQEITEAKSAPNHKTNIAGNL